MTYLISFLEGIITFISPCLLPMLPIYISYFTGSSGENGESGERSAAARTLKNALGFVLGFTLLFVAMGALAGTLGGLVRRYQTAVNLITGLIVIVFGLHFLGLFQLSLFRGSKHTLGQKPLGFFSSLLFGIVFSVGWTPCIGAFLGSALLMASQQGQTVTGILMLLCYSLGLGIPFVLSAILIDRLRGAFDVIKRHYRLINTVCGILLIAVGLLMMTGLLGRMLTLLN